MTKLYLITGFLGAGKTTFLHQFVRLFPDRRTAIVVNEFGKQGVDGTLLEDLDIKMEEINNGSIFCACKIEQFEDALLRLQKENFDVIITALAVSAPILWRCRECADPAHRRALPSAETSARKYIDVSVSFSDKV